MKNDLRDEINGLLNGRPVAAEAVVYAYESGIFRTLNESRQWERSERQPTKIDVCVCYDDELEFIFPGLKIEIASVKSMEVHLRRCNLSSDELEERLKGLKTVQLMASLIKELNKE
jgi:hypothetical protein